MKPFEVVTDEEEDRAVLKVRVRRLELPMREDFLRSADELLEQPQTDLAVDLGGLPRIFSLFIGALVDLSVRAQRVGKAVTVYVSPAVATQLRKMSLDQSMNVQEAP